MNLTVSAFAVVVTAVFGAGSLTVAILNAVVGRGGRRADIADKVTEAWERTSERLDKDLAKIEAKCEKCETRLSVTERHLEEALDDARRVKAVLRALVRVLDANDPTQVDAAVTAARELI